MYKACYFPVTLTIINAHLEPGNCTLNFLIFRLVPAPRRSTANCFMRLPTMICCHRRMEGKVRWQSPMVSWSRTVWEHGVHTGGYLVSYWYMPGTPMTWTPWHLTMSSVIMSDQPYQQILTGKQWYFIEMGQYFDVRALTYECCTKF